MSINKDNEDISGDGISLYIANDPTAAQYLAERIGDKSKSLLELCCGVGVTLKIMSDYFEQVTGVDIDPEIIDLCKKNTSDIKNLHLIQGDVADEDLLTSLSAEIVIYDIPYWYPEKYSEHGDKAFMGSNPDIQKLVKLVQSSLTLDLVIFAPREQGYEYFSSLFGPCECEQIFIGEKYDRNYIYLGSLMKKDGETVKILNK